MKNRNAGNIRWEGAPVDRARGVAILLHGRGGSAADMAGLIGHLGEEGMAYALPEAKGGSWYPERFLVPTEKNEPALSGALQEVHTLVGQLEEQGMAAEQMALVGFSQGACLALEYVRRNPRRYGLVGGLSGALIGPIDTVRNPADLRKTPILLGCAEHDAHIPLEYVESSAADLSAARAVVTRMIFPGDGHMLYPQELDWLRIHLRQMAARG